MAAPIELGTDLKIGFNEFILTTVGGTSYTGYIAEDGLEWSYDTGDIDEVRNQDNETKTELVSNPGQRFKMAFVIPSDGAGGVTPPANGSLIEINSPSTAATAIYAMVQSASMRFSRLATILDIEAVVEDNMTALGAYDPV